MIIKYKQYVDYFSALDSKLYLQLTLSNAGKSFDEDVDVKVYFDRDTICNKENIPVPGNSIIEDINKNFDKIFRPEKTIDINMFSSYPVEYSFPDISLNGDSQRDNIKEYKTNIDITFCYDYFQDKEYDAISYKQEYIKQYSKIYFPSILVFNKKPDNLSYEIISKYSSEIVKGELIIKENV